MHDSNKRMAEDTSNTEVDIVARGGCRGMVAGASQVPATGTSRSRGEGGRRHGGGSSSEED